MMRSAQGEESTQEDGGKAKGVDSVRKAEHESVRGIGNLAEVTGRDAEWREKDKKESE